MYNIIGVLILLLYLLVLRLQQGGRENCLSAPVAEERKYIIININKLTHNTNYGITEKKHIHWLLFNREAKKTNPQKPKQSYVQ